MIAPWLDAGTFPVEIPMKFTSFVFLFVLTSTLLRGQPQRCALEDSILNGVYVMTITGTGGSPVWAPFTGPVAAMGTIVFDGAGKLQQSKVTIVAANPPLNVTPPFVIQGVYTVNRDCTGTLTFDFSPNPNGHYNLVISPDGRQVTMIATDKGDVITGTAVRLDHN